MYTIVIYIFCFQIYRYIPPIFNEVMTFCLVTLLGSLIIYSIRYIKDMPIVVDFIDIRKSGKVFVFLCMLFGGCGIILDIYNPMGCLITTASVASLLITHAIAFKEIVDKYVIPLRSSGGQLRITYFHNIRK